MTYTIIFKVFMETFGTLTKEIIKSNFVDYHFAVFLVEHHIAKSHSCRVSQDLVFQKNLRILLDKVVVQLMKLIEDEKYFESI